MPRKIRPGKVRRGGRPFLRTVEHFLQTGDIDVQPGDNPWLAVSLHSAAARDLRAAWQAGDQVALDDAIARLQPANLYA